MMHLIDDRPELWPYVLASLILHGLLFVFLPRAVAPAKFEEKPLEVFAVDAVPPAEGKTPFRIADIPKPAQEQKPRSAKFLGLYDSTAPEEQVGTSRTPGEGGQGGKLKTKIGAPVAKKPPAEKRQLSSKDKLYAFNKDLFEEKQRQNIDEGESAPGSSGALDDFYPDFRRGAHTYLNVLRYPGVEYFVRMKHAFKIAFNPEPVLREHFSRNIVTRGSIDVVLGVSVGRSGTLAELFVFRSSGIPAYDEEALRTVRASSPFSSPPEKFLADDGLLRMTWTFSVYL